MHSQQLDARIALYQYAPLSDSTDRSDSQSHAPLISWSACRGTLSDGEHSVAIECEVTVAHDAKVTLVVADVPVAAESGWLRDPGVRVSGRTLRHFSLSLKADNGDQLESRHVTLTNIGETWALSASVIRIRGEALTLTVNHAPAPDWAAAGTERIARYHLVGLRAFGQQQEDTDIGRVTLTGASDVTDFSKLAGELVIESATGSVADAEWLSAVDARIEEILLMVSLGAGRLVRWGVREFAVGSIRRSLEFRGSQASGPPHEPMFHHLAFEPALRLGTHHYRRSLGERTGLDIAVEWYLMSHHYAESGFLASMTALEHLVAKHVDQLGAVLPKAAFRRVRESLVATLADPPTREAVRAALLSTSKAPAEADATAVAALEQLAQKLGNLNRLSLQQSVIALLELYDVSHADLRPDVRQLIKIRNNIVHRGIHSPGDEGEPLIEAVAALRELLRRLFLAILGYKGRYGPGVHDTTVLDAQDVAARATPPSA